MINYKSALNDIKDYPVIYCKKSGAIKECNDIAKNEIVIKKSNNVLDYILPEYQRIIIDMLNNANPTHNNSYSYVVGATNYNNYYVTYIHLKDHSTILSFKNINEKNNNDKFWNEKIISLQVSLEKSNKVLRCISRLCKDVLYKNRSDLEGILLDICTSLELEKCSVCFKNGINHIIYCKKTDLNTYECSKYDGTLTESCYFHSQEEYNRPWKITKFIKIPCDQCCLFTRDGDTEKYKNRSIGVIQLLHGKVIGYFHFLTKSERNLSDTEIESIQDLSHVLAYIVNNKEEVRTTIDYINKKFQDLT